MEEVRKMTHKYIYVTYPSLRSVQLTIFQLFSDKFHQFYRALYGDAMLVYQHGTPIWRPEVNKDIILDFT